MPITALQDSLITLERLKMELTVQQAAIIGAYTGVLCGNFSDLHHYIEVVMNRPVWTHELADQEFMTKLEDASRPDFIYICNKQESQND